MLQHIPRRRQRPKVVLWGLFVVLASIPEVGPSPRTFHMHGPGWSSPQPLSTHCALFFAKSVDLDQSPSFVLGAIGWALVFRPLGTRLVRALVRRWCSPYGRLHLQLTIAKAMGLAFKGKRFKA